MKPDIKTSASSSIVDIQSGQVHERICAVLNKELKININKNKKLTS